MASNPNPKYRSKQGNHFCRVGKWWCLNQDKTKISSKSRNRLILWCFEWRCCCLLEESLQLSYTIMEEHVPLSFSLSLSASDAPPSSQKQSIPSDAVIFFGLSLALGIACRHLLRGTKVPYTVALLILGIVLGSLGSLFPPFFIIIFYYYYYYY